MALILALDDAHKHNRVTIDRKGESVVHYKIDKKLQKTFIKALKACAELVFSAGAKRAHLPGAGRFFIFPEDLGDIDNVIHENNFKLGQVAVNSAHLMGGCKMGDDPRTSVTNSWGKVHGFNDLYVADASLFPSCSEVNPYLTIMALADRVAEGVKREM